MLLRLGLQVLTVICLAQKGRVVGHDGEDDLVQGLRIGNGGDPGHIPRPGGADLELAQYADASSERVSAEEIVALKS